MQIHTTFTIKLNSILNVQVLNQNRLSLMNQRRYVRIRVVVFSYIVTILALQFAWHVYMIIMSNWPICS